MDNIIFTYTDVVGRKCGFVLHAESQMVSGIIWETVNKVLNFMQQNGTVINYSATGDTYAGEIYE